MVMMFWFLSLFEDQLCSVVTCLPELANAIPTAQCAKDPVDALALKSAPGTN